MRTILLADDSVTIRKVVELTFGDTDIHVEAVGSGEEALARLDALKPDLVLADVAMPGLTGYEVCQYVKSSARPVPVLLLAGAFEPFDAERARACGADGHLVKPFESRSLVSRVEDLLARLPVPPEVRPERDQELELEAVLDEIASRDDGSAFDTLRGALPDDTPGIASETSRGGAAEPPDLPVPGTVAPAARLPLTAEEIDAVARAVVLRLAGDVLREVAWDVVPDLAELIIRERLREIEGEERARG
jgi:CheY-like chemotaxis protein